MSSLITILTIVGIVLGIVLLAVIAVKCCWKIAGTNEVLIVSGLGKVKTKTGGGLFVIPVVQKTQRMTLENIQVDFTSRAEIPTKDAINITVDAVANMAIFGGANPERQAIAASKFPGYSLTQIRDIVIPVLEGNIREIISTIEFEELIRGDKKLISEKVQENVRPNLADLGIDLTTFNIQSFSDNKGVINDLGIENTEKIKKDASIAAAKAKAAVAIAQAEADKAANDAKVAAATEIAEKQNQFAIRKAELQAIADTEQAKADAAKQIEAENQRKQHEIAIANANLAKQEKEIELKEREVAIEERRLEAEVKKNAEAQKYAEQQKADAKLYAAQKAAEADLFERERQAEAAKIEAEKKAEADLALATAEAEAQKRLAEAVEAEGKAKAAAAEAQGLAEAAAIKAKAEAEAEGLLKKAEAMEKYGEAAKQDMQLEALKVLYTQLPAIAEAIGRGYAGADIHLIGSDSGQLAGNMMGNITQIIEGFKGATGVDPMSVISGMLGAKITENQ
jgi:flotillin